MTSAYTLAKDKLEQARAVLASDTWFDPAADHLINLAIVRMIELERLAANGLTPPPEPDKPGRRLRRMPWLIPRRE